MSDNIFDGTRNGVAKIEILVDVSLKISLTLITTNDYLQQWQNK